MQLILKPHKRVSKIEYILIIEYCPQPLFPHAAHRSPMVQDKLLSTQTQCREGSKYPPFSIAYLNIYEDKYEFYNNFI